MRIRVIYKYYIPLGTIFKLDIPKGYEVLKFGMQGASLVLWAMVDPSAPMDRVTGHIYGTGQEFELTDFHRYIGTVQYTTRDDEMVWHLFLEDGVPL